MSSWIICWGLIANERIRATESIPEIVYLLGLADERCSGTACTVLPPLAKPDLLGG
jgi:hypothetical protein